MKLSSGIEKNGLDLREEKVLGMKRLIGLILVLTMTMSLFAACGKKEEDTSKNPDSNNGGDQVETKNDGDGEEDNNPDQAEEQVLKVAAFDGGYGTEMWDEITKKFMADNPGVTIELTAEKNLEEVISPLMKAGEYPDFVYLATGRELALPETLLKDKAILDISDVLSMEVPGEDITVGDKVIAGFTETLVTNPYGDGKTYLAPMFYSPCGLWYDANLLESKGWEVPETWDEMWELGDKAKEEGISLFTYPVAGYFDAFVFGLLAEIGGSDFYNKAMTYEDGIWETPEARKVFDIIGKLAQYMEPTTVGNANGDNFKKNQQLVLDNKAIFMPNGNWIIEEMKDAPRADGFEWGFMPLPAVEDGGDRCAFTFFEQSWIPEQAENKELAKKFMAYLYTDEAAEIFATKGGAIQPIKDVSKYISDENTKTIYSIYDTGAVAAMGGFASTEAVEGVSMKETLFFTIDSIVTGDKTVDEWQKAVEEVSDQLRDAMN